MSRYRRRARAGSARETTLHLVIVALVIAGLGALATPNFRASRERSDRRAAQATHKTVAGALEMYNLDNHTAIGTADRRVMDELVAQGYLQSVPSGRMLELMAEHPLPDAPAVTGETVYTGTLPSRRSWLERSAPLTATGPAELARTPSPELSVEDFVTAAEDPLSTFSVDVDTGSYTLARDLLRAGRLPDADAIRAEEFVNAFEYGDAPPREGDFAVHSEVMPWQGHPGRALLRVGLKAREIAPEDRPPLRLTFVVDVSGSMRGATRIGLVRRSLEMLVGQLREDDRVGIVTYGTRAEDWLPPTDGLRKEELRAAIRGMRIKGSTNFERGLRRGYAMAAAQFDPDAENRVILCSDGLANQGITGADALLREVVREAERGIRLATFGFGMSHEGDRRMEQLADGGDGVYGYVDDVEEARRLLVERLTGTLVTVARDAKVQVVFDPRVVRAYRVVGYRNREIADADFRVDAVDAGEVGAGHTVSAVYELDLVPGAEGSVGLVHLRWKAARGDRVTEIQEPLAGPAAGGALGSGSPALRLAAAVTRFAEVLGGSPHARDVSLEELGAEVRELAPRVPGGDRVGRELGDLVYRAAKLSRPAP